MKSSSCLRTRILAACLGIAVTGLACDGRPSPPQESSDEIRPREVLEQAAAALRDTRAVRYRFEYGGPDDPTGWVTGTTWMKQMTDMSDSWIRVEGTMHDQPRYDVVGRTFSYGIDDGRAWAIEDEGPLESSPVGAGSNLLSAYAVYGYLPEYVEASPLWRELGDTATHEMLEPESVDGTPCHVVRVELALEGGGSTVIVWSVGQEDHLLHRGRWIADYTGPEGVVFTMTGIEVGLELSRDDFAPPETTDEPVKSAVGIGEVVPDWSLRTSDGDEVSLEELSGDVIVLDFWNTWCPICRSIGPATRELARELEGQPVRFFGVNLLEMGDPITYWKSIGAPYTLLLEGEELASTLDLPWQPGIAVIGPDGTLLYKQLGASEDRIHRVREAVMEGIGQIEDSR